MVSNLKWRTGTGWPSIILLISLVYATMNFHGIWRWASILLTLFQTLFVAQNIHRYNGRPWRRVHFRGMMLYASLAGIEKRTAEEEGRPFNIVNPCRELGLAICGKEKALFVDAMIEELLKEKGEFFINLIEGRHRSLFQDLDESKFKSLLKSVKNFEFGPQIVMCNIIKNSYGQEEAANYVKALITKQAF